MTKEIYIPHDISINPLLIKTNRAAGSGDLLDLFTANEGQFGAGGVVIHFDNPLEYELTYCTTSRQTFINLPAEQDKIWEIFYHRINGKTERVEIKCNEIVVVDFQISTCLDGFKWAYDKNPIQFKFQEADTASDSIDRLGLHEVLRNSFLRIRIIIEIIM